MATAVKPKAVEDYSKAPINAKLSREEKVRLLTDMVRIRRFEMKSLEVYQKGTAMGGFMHSISDRRAWRRGHVRSWEITIT
jgi:TPP-dependent pyruvate/acetoin dehydrogenase alpha subunit